MFHRKTCISLAMILALTAAGAFAQVPGTTPPATAAPPAPTMPAMPMGSMPGASGMPMGSMPMMGMMQMMMGQHGMAGHVEGRIAFLKAELKITDAQLPLWNGVADAIRTDRKSAGGMPDGMAMMNVGGTLPEKLAAREKMMTARLETLRKLRAAVEPLYTAFDNDQKKAADELMIGPMGMMGMGMM